MADQYSGKPPREAGAYGTVPNLTADELAGTPRRQTPDPAPPVYARARLWLTADRQSVALEGDAAAAYLLAGVGDQIEQVEVDRLSLTDGTLVQVGGVRPYGQPAGRTLLRDAADGSGIVRYPLAPNPAAEEVLL